MKVTPIFLSNVARVDMDDEGVTIDALELAERLDGGEVEAGRLSITDDRVFTVDGPHVLLFNSESGLNEVIATGEVADALASAYAKLESAEAQLKEAEWELSNKRGALALREYQVEQEREARIKAEAQLETELGVAEGREATIEKFRVELSDARRALEAAEARAEEWEKRFVEENEAKNNACVAAHKLNMARNEAEADAGRLRGLLQKCEQLLLDHGDPFRGDDWDTMQEIRAALGAEQAFAASPSSNSAA